MSATKSTRKQTVRLRKKDLTNGNKSLYLDIWVDGRRTYEFLKLYINKPKNASDRVQNNETMRLAEDIRAKRQLDLQNSRFGFSSEYKLDTNFIEYFKTVISSKGVSIGNASIWKSTLKHLSEYRGTEITFHDLDHDYVEGFKNYLSKTAKTKNEKSLAQNSQAAYFSKLKASINQAIDDQIILYNPAQKVNPIKQLEPEKQYLTIEELRLLVNTECRHPVLKRAFMFSCLTGMRWSDIQKLKWEDIEKDSEGWKIKFRQQKTKSIEYLNINSQAKEYLGDVNDSDEKIFNALQYSSWYNSELQNWVFLAGIKKRITFHCARHTHAILLLNNDVDLYTVSKLLGHKNIKTTQVYAKILDKTKMEAVNKLPEL